MLSLKIHILNTSLHIWCDRLCVAFRCRPEDSFFTFIAYEPRYPL
jgi:hypothetical protein